MFHLRRLLPPVGLWFACLTVAMLGCGVAHAQESSAAALSSSVPTPTDTELKLAHSSLTGPIAETVGGGVMIIGVAPFAGFVAAALSGEPILCNDAEEDCAGMRRRGRKMGLWVGLVSGAIGAAIVAHGAYRIHEIKVARRRVRSFPTAHLDLDTTGAGMHFAWSF